MLLDNIIILGIYKYIQICLSALFSSAVFVQPALAGRHRRASFRTFVSPSIRQHLTWVSCEPNSSYSFVPIVLKLCMCFLHGMRMCMWIAHNCWISFCHFLDIVNLVIFHPEYIDSGCLLWAQLLLHFWNFSDKTVLMSRIVWAFTSCLCNNYHNHITWIIV